MEITWRELIGTVAAGISRQRVLIEEMYPCGSIDKRLTLDVSTASAVE